MYRPVIELLAMLALLAAPAAADDAIGPWLRRMGCDRLLASHLEHQLTSDDAGDRVNAAQELAGLYAILLARSSDEERLELIERARVLVETIPDAGTDELRLQLLATGYQAAQEVILQRRLRQVDEQAERLALDQLHDLRTRLRAMQVRLARQATRAGPQSTAAVQAARVTSLLAWCGYYLARSGDDPPAAMDSANLFARLLEAETASLQEVSLDLRTTEGGAWSILGIAQCKEVSGDPAGPEPWLEVLDKKDTWPAVRSQLPLRRLLMSVDRGDWAAVRGHIETKEGAVPWEWYLLGAVHGLEHPQSEDARALAHMALGGLVSSGQWMTVYGIAQKHGTAILDQETFIGAYIAGAMAFEAAGSGINHGDRVEDPTQVAAFRAAAEALDAALATSDAAEHPRALATCQELIGRCRWRIGDLDLSAKAYAAASDAGQGEEATWGAIVALDRIEQRSEAQETMRVRLVDRYLATWPNTERAGQLMIAEAAQRPDLPETLELLLEVPPDHSAYEIARREASRILFGRWRKADDADRGEIGNQYINVALPCAIASVATAGEFDESVHATAAGRSLRILEVALHRQVGRTIAAQRALELVDTLIVQRRLDGDPIAGELEYRRLTLALREGGDQAATPLLEQMLEQRRDGKWTERGLRATASATQKRWRGGDDGAGPLLHRWAMALVRIHGDILFRDDWLVALAVDAVTIGAAAVDAGGAVAEDDLELVRSLRARHERNAVILRAAAILEARGGDQEAAVDAWRTLARGQTRGTTPWFEARTHVMEHVAAEDPETAMTLLSQHAAMYPDWGPSPWGDRIRALHESLESAP